MGLATKIALGVGIPAAIIVAAGYFLNKYKPVIQQSAGAVGSSFADIVAEPVKGFFGQIENAFADLPDTNIRIPGINLTGGLFTFKQEEPPRDISGETSDGVTFGEGTTFDPNTGIIEGTPPTFDILPEAQGAELTPRQGSLPFQTGTQQPLTRESIADIIKQFPNAVGLFDLLDIPGTQFVPLAAYNVESIGAENLKFSGQLFEEIRGFGDIQY